MRYVIEYWTGVGMNDALEGTPDVNFLIPDGEYLTQRYWVGVLAAQALMFLTAPVVIPAGGSDAHR